MSAILFMWLFGGRGAPINRAPRPSPTPVPIRDPFMENIGAYDTGNIGAGYTPGVHTVVTAVTPQGNSYAATVGGVTQPYTQVVAAKVNVAPQTLTAPSIVQNLVAPGSALPAPAPGIGLAPRVVRL